MVPHPILERRLELKKLLSWRETALDSIGFPHERGSFLNTAYPAFSKNGTIQSFCDRWTVGCEANRSGAACRLLRMFCTGRIEEC